jgi:hypothetical protein
VQSDRYIAENWTRHFHLLEVVPGGIDDWQDLVILRKPKRSGDEPAPALLPAWPPEGMAPPQSVEISLSGPSVVGGEITLEARARGGQDVRYRFSVERPLIGRVYLSDWQADPRTGFRPTQPGLAELFVEANSGAGYHCAPAVAASAETVVRAFGR